MHCQGILKGDVFQTFCSEPGKIIHSLVKAGRSLTPLARALRGFAKGQLISKQICGILEFSKRATKYIARISSLASKMGQIKKIKAILYTK